MLRWPSRARPGLPPPACLLLLLAVSVSLLLPLSQACGFIRYHPYDLVKVLDADTLRDNVLSSRSAWVIEFYANWCSDCFAFAPTWRALAKDVKDWRPTVMLGVIDCGEMSNEKICSIFGIKKYPTLKFFKPFSKHPDDGIKISETGDDLQRLRESIITLVESHENAFLSRDSPLLMPLSANDSFQFQDNNVVVIFEDKDSFLGREVILGMAQFANITVRRVLKGDEKLVDRCGVPTLPSLFLLPSKDSCVPIILRNMSRCICTTHLQKLSGVFRKINFTDPDSPSVEPKINHTLWEVANRSKIYMADLQSAVFCSLRQIEIRFSYLDKERVDALKKYVNALAKYFPANSMVKNDLHKLNDWLKLYVTTDISRSKWTKAFMPIKKALNGTKSDARTWVGCQGSQPLLRGYPCSIWTLFHFLTVQEGLPVPNNENGTPSVALSTLREFMKNFYGCRKCAKSFEIMAKESMDEVKNTDEAILWLWSKHNIVNFWLAGEPSEDAKFPKIQWPSQDLCLSCNRTINGKDAWNKMAVLNFIKQHFSTDNISLEFIS
ncbi:sulfhydryl oxidase 1-like [Elgaria multicarinata webbii]|uniref:sulfhydryl oxidase 1-like n=1 Tax=Elgaria multicarinata webbii TaxID=159646 RepID=UPI002FCD18BB